MLELSELYSGYLELMENLSWYLKDKNKFWNRNPSFLLLIEVGMKKVLLQWMLEIDILHLFAIEMSVRLGMVTMNSWQFWMVIFRSKK